MTSKTYYQKHKAEIIAKNTARNQLTVQHRRDLLSQFSCNACGNIDPSVIQWHHINPQEKKFEIFRTAWPVESFWDEVLKCVPLCGNCHIKIHKNQLCLLPQKL
jgi:hypothetical protein